MEKRDAFVRGLALIFQERPSLKPSRVATDAGLDNSTIRKMLAGESGSPKVETAQKIAEQLGMPLSVIVAIGESDEGLLILRLASRIAQLDPDAQRQIDGYIEVKMQQAPQLQEQDQKSHAAAQE